MIKRNVTFPTGGNFCLDGQFCVLIKHGPMRLL